MKWKIKTLSDITVKAHGNLQTGPFGSQLHQADYEVAGTPVIMPKDLISGHISTDSIARVGAVHVQRLHQHVVREGDIIFSRRGDVGRSAYVTSNEDGWLCGTGCLRATIDKTIANSRFVFESLQQPSTICWLTQHAIGAIMLNLNTQILSQVPICLPPLPEQRAIAGVLSALDDKIELNRKICKELEETAKLIYDYWFVQFDFPDARGRPYRSSGGKMVYSPVLKRDIPAGWKVGCYNDLLSSTRSGDWGKEQREGNYVLPVRCIRGADIPVLRLGEQGKIPLRYIHDGHKDKLLKDGDLVIEISGGSPTQSTGRIVLILQEILNRFDHGLVCTNFCRALTPKAGCASYVFWNWNRQYSAGVMFRYEHKTTGIKNLDLERFLADEPIVIPPQDYLSRYHDWANVIQRKIVKCGEENDLLSSLRDWLLPLLLSGQVAVKGT